jgi:hypothetical protein
MKYPISKSFVVDTDITKVINLISSQFIPLHVKIIEQTETKLRFQYSGNFLRATHPVSWISEGTIQVTSKSDLPLPGFVEIFIQVSLTKIIRFLILFPVILCGTLTAIAYLILGSSMTQILQTLGLMYLLVILAMLLGYIFVKQIIIQFFQTLCETLPPTGSYPN